MAYKNVAVAGATGNLGPTVVSALVDAGFQVTVLSRSNIPPNIPSGVKVVQVDYTSQDSLVSALQGQDAFVSNIPNHADQPILIDAAITAGVKHFIPSEFGSNIYGNEKARNLPVFAGKVKTQEYLKTKESQISYTIITNGLFLDWGLSIPFLLLNTKGVTEVFDSGDQISSTTTLSDVGKAVVGVLRHPSETKNRGVYVQSAVVSQNLLLRLAKKIDPAFKGEVKKVSTETVEKESYEELRKEKPDVGKASFAQIRAAVLGVGFGSYWGEKNDNELFGIETLDEGQLEELVRKIAF